MSSISLPEADWTFLKSLSIDLQADDSSSDPAMDASRASASEAVRWLIQKERERRQRGGIVRFKAGGGATRVYDIGTGQTTMHHRLDGQPGSFEIQGTNADLRVDQATASKKTSRKRR